MGEALGQVLWITGQTGSGKSTVLRKMAGPNTILLDGDSLRTVWPELTLTRTDRWEQNLRAARLARMLADQGYFVVVATIAPYEKLRREIRALTRCTFIFVDYNQYPDDPERPYEDPWDAEMIVRRKQRSTREAPNGA